ncbi:MAG: 4Fe-4S dicluster domain-containing protein [Acidimicrobiales bacterium]|jgi:ferredoxin
MRVGDQMVMSVDGLDALVTTLAGFGYETKGPVVRDGAILPGPVQGVSDLPVGTGDVQSPGRYRLEQRDDDAVFGWAVGPGSWKAEFFPPTQELWRSTVDGDAISITTPDLEMPPLAVIGARPCELAGLAVLDRVLLDGSFADPRYADRRSDAFVVAAECGSPAGTCFCTSMGTGPGAESGFDLALTELDDDSGHRFVVRVGTELGADVLARVSVSPASAEDLAARDRVLSSAGDAIGRRLETEGLAELLQRNLDHPRWDEVADRCLACGNCTLVCPTCFCSDVSDTTDLSGEVERRRTWASCFDLDHSHLHGGPVRSSTSSRYRQWLTHKLSTWWDQFDTSGCVGCGRCIAWCPVGIDLTEEAAAIRDSDGSVPSSGSSPGGRP